MSKPENSKRFCMIYIKWNFTKFLVDRHGNVTQRFSPTVAPEELEKEIEMLLSK